MSNTAKSHKSRKSGSLEQKPRTRKSLPDESLSGGPSSTELAMTAPTPSSNTIVDILTAPSTEDTKEESTAAPATGVPAVEPKTQWWFRAPDSKTRKVFEKIMVQRAAGRKDEWIAKKLDTTAANVRNVVYIARKNGWLDANDEVVDIEADLALDIDRKVVRNISASLDGQMTNWQTHEMTIAAAKGRGHFRNYEVSKNDGAAAMSVVAIQVVMPPVGAGDQLPQVDESSMGGVPAYLDADVLTD